MHRKPKCTGSWIPYSHVHKTLHYQQPVNTSTIPSRDVHSLCILYTVFFACTKSLSESDACSKKLNHGDSVVETLGSDEMVVIVVFWTCHVYITIPNYICIYIYLICIYMYLYTYKTMYIQYMYIKQTCIHMYTHIRTNLYRVCSNFCQKPPAPGSDSASTSCRSRPEKKKRGGRTSTVGWLGNCAMYVVYVVP